MPQGRSGVSASTPQRMMFDAGEGFVDIDTDILESDGLASALAAGTSLGATRGGSSFAPGRSLRRMDADGLIGPTKGFFRRQDVAPVLTLNLLEMTAEQFVRIIAGAAGEDTAGTTDQFQKITAGEVSDAAYMDNVAFLASYAGEDNPVLVVVRNTIVIDPPDLGTAPQDEAVLAVPFAGTFDPAEVHVEPWTIYHPETLA